jgi:hypothetical protein
MFGVTPAHTAKILLRYHVARLGLARIEIVNLDRDHPRISSHPVGEGGGLMTVTVSTLVDGR